MNNVLFHQHAIINKIKVKEASENRIKIFESVFVLITYKSNMLKKNPITDMVKMAATVNMIPFFITKQTVYQLLVQLISLGMI